MKNKNLKIAGLILMITTIIGIALSVVNGIDQLNYIKDLKSDVVKNLIDNVKPGSDYSSLSATWTVYMGFGLSPISLLIVGFFNFVVWKSDKDGRTIVKWPVIVVLVFAIISALGPLINMLTSDSEFMLSKIKDIKNDGNWDAVKNIIKPLRDAHVKPALGWVEFAISIFEVLVTIPTIMQIKKNA